MGDGCRTQEGISTNLFPDYIESRKVELKPYHTTNGRKLRENDCFLTVTLPPEMFGAFWSVWCKIALGEGGVSLP